MPHRFGHRAVQRTYQQPGRTRRRTAKYAKHLAYSRCVGNHGSTSTKDFDEENPGIDRSRPRKSKRCRQGPSTAHPLSRQQGCYLLPRRQVRGIRETEGSRSSSSVDLPSPLPTETQMAWITTTAPVSRISTPRGSIGLTRSQAETAHHQDAQQRPERPSRLSGQVAVLEDVLEVDRDGDEEQPEKSRRRPHGGHEELMPFGRHVSAHVPSLSSSSEYGFVSHFRATIRSALFDIDRMQPKALGSDVGLGRRRDYRTPRGRNCTLIRGPIGRRVFGTAYSHVRWRIPAHHQQIPTPQLEDDGSGRRTVAATAVVGSPPARRWPPWCRGWRRRPMVSPCQATLSCPLR